MAEVVIEAVVGVIVENLISLLQEQFHFVRGVEKDVEKLVSTLETIRAVLVDAEKKQINDGPIALWLRRLKDATYDADDILDGWSTQVGQRELDSSNGGCTCTSQVSHSVLSFSRIISHRKLAKQIKKILSRFNDIAEEKGKFNLNSTAVLQTESRVQTMSKLSEPHVYGREEDTEKITALLLDNVGGAQPVFSIRTILGMGGLGKTTLAQSVYNDERVVQGFDIRFWVCVSNSFDVKRILLAISETFELKKPDLESLEAIQVKVRDILREKKYLIVLDDVWNVQETEWNQLMSVLGDGAKGSSIIITTRLETTTSLTGGLIHRLSVLNKNDSWSLLKHRAVGDNCELHPNLVAIGRDIVAKCKGVPLAVKSLGSLLAIRTDEEHWEFVRDSEIWKLKEGGDNNILPALRLSYNSLTSHLKQCFSYCSIFPKGYIIDRNELINMWIANNLIRSQRNRELERVGDDILRELLQSSFFEVVGKAGGRNIERYKMHDLMHDLACSIAVDECLAAKVGEAKDVCKSFRHLSIYYDSPNVVPLLTSQPSLRTLFCFNLLSVDRLIFPSTLRVLKLSSSYITTLPPSISHLKLLRYLDLSDNTHLQSLPEGIHSLRNLQSLILSGCGNLKQLLKFITGIRHLDIYGCKRLKRMPVGIGRFLQPLDYFVVGPSNSGWAGISELQQVNQVRGEYYIRGLENVGDAEEAKKANFRSKPYLTKLTLEWDLYANQELPQKRNIKEVLEALQLPPNIQKLAIDDYPWETCFPQAFLRDANLLQDLRFCFCREMNSLPAGLLQSLPSLKTFKISWCKSIRCLPLMGIQGSNNSLVHLDIEFCNNLTSLSLGLRYLTSLETLSVSFCEELEFATEDFQHLISLRSLKLIMLPKVTFLPGSIQHLTMLQHLEINHCKNLSMLNLFSAVLSLQIGNLDSLTSLETLDVSRCPELKFATEDFQRLISLRTLKLKYLPQLKGLPEGMQHLTMLQQLKIKSCKNLRVLPESLQHLTTLQFLKIIWCHPELYTRYNKDSHVISHIPHIELVP